MLSVGNTCVTPPEFTHTDPHMHKLDLNRETMSETDADHSYEASTDSGLGAYFGYVTSFSLFIEVVDIP